MIKRTVYQCEHCKQFKVRPKIYFSEYDMYLHEHNCFYNLENKTCFTCEHNKYGRHDAGLDMKVNDCLLDVAKPVNIYTVSDTIKRDCPHWQFPWREEDYPQ